MLLTVVFGHQVDGSGVVVGGPGVGRRGHSEHVRCVLLEISVQAAPLAGGRAVGLVWQRGAGGGGLLQGDQVEGPAIGLHGGVPADDEARGAEVLRRQVVDGVIGH